MNESSKFTWHIIVDEIQTILKKSISSSQTSAKGPKFLQQNELKTWLKQKTKCHQADLVDQVHKTEKVR